jgi:hypothetical protein
VHRRCKPCVAGSLFAFGEEERFGASLAPKVHSLALAPSAHEIRCVCRLCSPSAKTREMRRRRSEARDANWVLQLSLEGLLLLTRIITSKFPNYLGHRLYLHLLFKRVIFYLKELPFYNKTYIFKKVCKEFVNFGYK